MKKRIFALLLATMITATMVACDSSTGDRVEGDPNAGQVQGDGTTPTPDTPAPEVVTWQDTNDTVYVIGQNLFLTGVDNPQDVKVAPQYTKLSRLKKGSNGKSIVVMDGVQYTTLTNQLTTDDLLGESFTPCNPTIMYISDNDVAVRKYAHKSSDLIKKLYMNETVQVIAKGEKWVKIQYDANNQYFVNADYVSANEVVDANDINNYPAFTPVTESYNLYVLSTSLTLRKCPSTASDALTTLEYGDQLIVLKTGVVEGDTWYLVRSVKEGGVGQGSIITEGYVAQSKYVSTENPTPSLEEMLALYPAFTALAQPATMYVSTDATSLNARSAPDASADNVKFAIAQKAAVKVVATGSQNGIYWAMIEQEDAYFFVSYTYLTTKADGTPEVPTLEQILAAYPGFTAATPFTATAKKVTNCNPKPEEKPADKDTVQLTEGETVSVEATGEYGGKTWYVFKKGDSYFFAGAEMFTVTPPSVG